MAVGETGMPESGIAGSGFLALNAARGQPTPVRVPPAFRPNDLPLRRAR
jgi:hypothetical protein